MQCSNDQKTVFSLFFVCVRVCRKRNVVGTMFCVFQVVFGNKKRKLENEMETVLGFYFYLNEMEVCIHIFFSFFWRKRFFVVNLCIKHAGMDVFSI